MTDNDDHHSGEPNWEEIYVLPKEEITLTDFDCADGWILDIGAGGEGVIGILKGARVIGIDSNQRELKETSNDSLKIVMDATDLKFLDSTFDTVTVFFTFMYMSWEDVEKVFAEIARVIKPGGDLLVWDIRAKIPESEKGKKYMMIWLKINLPDGKTIESGYGYFPRDQSADEFLTIAKKHGFKQVEHTDQEAMFFLRLQKE